MFDLYFIFDERALDDGRVLQEARAHHYFGARDEVIFHDSIYAAFYTARTCVYIGENYRGIYYVVRRIPGS